MKIDINNAELKEFTDQYLKALDNQAPLKQNQRKETIYRSKLKNLKRHIVSR